MPEIDPDPFDPFAMAAMSVDADSFHDRRGRASEQQGEPRVIEHPFLDPISGQTMTLRIAPEPSLWDGKTGVAHPGCERLADISADLDCFYCPECGCNGRVSGAWVVDMLNEVRAGARS